MAIKLWIYVASAFVVGFITYLKPSRRSYKVYRASAHDDFGTLSIVQVEEHTIGEGMPPFTPIERLNPPVTTFYAHGDVPYTRIQARKLKQQMLSVPDDAEFIIHVGDVRMAGPHRLCMAEEYESAAALLRLSPVPVFMLLGDNDIVDCPNRAEGQRLWRKEFSQFDRRYWNHTFSIQRPKHYPENFAFEHKDVLFIGVNIVGEHPSNATTVEEITRRLTEQVEWVMETMRTYQRKCIYTNQIVGRIVIFYHANPGPPTRPFFKPLRHFIGNDLNHTTPVLFLNGDAHRWMYQPRFYNESSLLRVTVTGLAEEPLLKVKITSDGLYHDPTLAFAMDRRLPPVLRLDSNGD